MPAFLGDLDTCGVISDLRVSTPPLSGKFRWRASFQVSEYATVHRLEPEGATRRDKEELDAVRFRCTMRRSVRCIHVSDKSAWIALGDLLQPLNQLNSYVFYRQATFALC
jgi:hypothetical protein